MYCLSGTGSPRVPGTRAGTGTGKNLYPAAGMGFLASRFYFRGHGFGNAIPNGYMPVAISICAIVSSVISSPRDYYFSVLYSLCAMVLSVLCSYLVAGVPSKTGPLCHVFNAKLFPCRDHC